MALRRAGITTIVGGMMWLAGVLILELTYDSELEPSRFPSKLS